MNVGEGHAAFANAAGDTFDGTVADVTGTEDTGHAGFKPERFAVNLSVKNHQNGANPADEELPDPSCGCHRLL